MPARTSLPSDWIPDCSFAQRRTWHSNSEPEEPCLPDKTPQRSHRWPAALTVGLPDERHADRLQINLRGIRGPFLPTAGLDRFQQLRQSLVEILDAIDPEARLDLLKDRIDRRRHLLQELAPFGGQGMKEAPSVRVRHAAQDEAACPEVPQDTREAFTHEIRTLRQRRNIELVRLTEDAQYTPLWVGKVVQCKNLTEM